MKDLIMTSYPLEELKAVISETVKNEINKHLVSSVPSDSEYITRKKTAEILGISLPTLNSWTKQGIVNSYRIATRVRYKKDEVYNCLKSSKNERKAK